VILQDEVTELDEQLHAFRERKRLEPEGLGVVRFSLAVVGDSRANHA
jgi:hypothetical protein